MGDAFFWDESHAKVRATREQLNYILNLMRQLGIRTVEQQQEFIVRRLVGYKPGDKLNKKQAGQVIDLLHDYEDQIYMKKAQMEYDANPFLGPAKVMHRKSAEKKWREFVLVNTETGEIIGYV